MRQFSVCCFAPVFLSRTLNSNCFTNAKLHYPFLFFPCSSFLSGTTSTVQGTRSWAWPAWPRTSWQRSLTSCFLLWRVGGSNPALLCLPPLTPPQCPLPPQKPLLPPTCTPENEGTDQSSTVVCNIGKGGCVFVSLCFCTCVLHGSGLRMFPQST